MPLHYQIIVLYEDQRDPAGDFPFHELILSCVYDSIDRNRQILTEKIKGNPKKGNSKLLRSLREDLSCLRDSCQHVIAVFDDDKVRELIGLGKKAKEQEVIEEIKASLPDCASIFLLKKNMETVIGDIGECDGAIDQNLLDSALNKRSLNARDRVIKRAVPINRHELRECILEKNPSLKSIVDGVCGLLGGDPFDPVNRRPGSGRSRGRRSPPSPARRARSRSAG
ncbi:MAG: hypothetical protein JXR96_10240 [Deltaproteobacteria bacterium]|nr:hypothetical protein [Deltaproteobacteria bacterium]